MKYRTDYFIINEYIDMKNRVRKIKFTDKAEVLKWRNDLNTRKNSLNSNAVTIEEHNNWFKKIMDGSCHISFMLEVNDIKAGFVSYEKKTNNELYTSINLNPDFRGKNLGSKFLNLTAKKLIMNGFIGTFNAKIKNGNFSSEKTFNNAGYEKNKVYKKYILYTYNVQKINLVKMKSKEKRKSYNKIIDQIEKIRSKNNTNWMDILRIAFEHSPKEASVVMSEIYNEDQKISLLAKKLKDSVKKS